MWNCGIMGNGLLGERASRPLLTGIAPLPEHPLRGLPVAGGYVCGGRGATALPGFATASLKERWIR